jgi:hypothetical protein
MTWNHGIKASKWEPTMRTTLDIDEDVLEAAKALARRQSISAGKVASQTLRSVLTG